MKKLYDKNELTFSLVWIALYVVLLSFADAVSDLIGISKLVTAPLCIAMTVALYVWIRKNGLTEKYGLCKFKGNAKQYLHFIPLVLLATTNVWWGVRQNGSVFETILFVISMLCVGFLEELIFRGFLFTSMCKDNVKRAVVISSVTFGVGHIVNLLNGKEIPETIMQIIYAVAVGFLFTILFYKGKCLWPCIITHSVVNSLSIFVNEENVPVWGDIAGGLFMCVISLCYVVYIIKTVKSENT